MTTFIANTTLGRPLMKSIDINVARARSKAGAFLGSEASRASFSKNPQKRSVPEASIIYIYIYIFFYIYCVYIQKNM
jgi:hypothetical protein